MGDGVSPPPTVRAFLAGQSGSGKSTRAWDLYLRRFPRRLLLDMTGEYEAKADHIADTVGAVVDGIRALAHRGRWTVTAALDASDLPDLVGWLLPVPTLHASPVLAVGGAVLLVDEVDLLAPPGTASEAVRTLYRRSRHVGLSVVSTTQRPANVSREVSAQSTQALALALSEPRDIDYVATLMAWDRPAVDRWQAWTRQHRHGAVWQDLRSREVRFFADAGGAWRHPAGPERVAPAVGREERA